MRPEQLERCLAYQRKGWTHERIAAELKVARETVSRALSKHNRRALAVMVKRAAAEKARQVAVLEWAIEQASLAWERSQQDAETLTEVSESGDAPGKGGNRSTMKIEGQVGDPRYLRELARALADIRKILGLDATPDAAPSPFSLADLTAAAEAAAAAHRAAERPAEHGE